MLIKSCFPCKYHEIRQDAEEKNSHCGKENCWSRYSKCIAIKALERFLKQETLERDSHPFSATERFYSHE